MYKGFSSGILLIGIFIVILIVSGFFLITLNRPQPQPGNKLSSSESNSTTVLSPEIKVLLNKKIKLVEDLARNSNLIKDIEASNSKDSLLSMSEIKKLDDEWIATKGENAFIKTFLENETAQILTVFQENNPEFPEIFVTDKVGLNVGQTNKTSDYYQADEDWWVTAFNNGTGKTYYGQIEYDDSSKSESIALYVPVYNSQKVVIGVFKAVLSLSALQREL